MASTTELVGFVDSSIQANAGTDNGRRMEENACAHTLGKGMILSKNATFSVKSRFSDLIHFPFL